MVGCNNLGMSGGLGRRCDARRRSRPRAPSRRSAVPLSARHSFAPEDFPTARAPEIVHNYLSTSIFSSRPAPRRKLGAPAGVTGHVGTPRVTKRPHGSCGIRSAEVLASPNYGRRHRKVRRVATRGLRARAPEKKGDRRTSLRTISGRGTGVGENAASRQKKESLRGLGEPASEREFLLGELR